MWNLGNLGLIRGVLKKKKKKMGWWSPKDFTRRLNLHFPTIVDGIIPCVVLRYEQVVCLGYTANQFADRSSIAQTDDKNHYEF
jgi:hypothetical protein